MNDVLRGIGLGSAVGPLLMSIIVVAFFPTPVTMVTIAAMLVSIQFTIVGLAIVIAGSSAARSDERVRQHGGEWQHSAETTE